ncbi:MAG: QacE family quaternary ammonium compound efflux SMR transporter [Woeseia sp.]|nr:QacE family quaternary ammonium compound efflux SMR transporter [Woeseia sp.]
MAYLPLTVAIFLEVVGTSALKASKEFSQLVPSLIVVVSYSASFYFLTLALKEIPLGVAYAIWAGVGIALISVIGVILYREVLDWPAVIGIFLIIVGVVLIRLFSNAQA